MIATTQDVADVFGVTIRAVQLWGQRGCPKAGRGRWNLREVLKWWLDNIYSIGDEDESIREAKTRYWAAKARTECVKADQAEGSVISKDEVVAAWAWRVSEMSTGLGTLPLRLAPLCVLKKEAEIRKILEKEIWNIRDVYSRTGKFTPVPKKKRAAKKKAAAKKRPAKKG